MIRSDNRNLARITRTFPMLQQLLLNYLRHFLIDHGKTRLAKLVTLPTGTQHYTNSLGVTLPLDLTEYQQRQIYLFDLYEKSTLLQLAKLTRPDMVALDVGANIGFYTLSLARLCKEGTVHAFEPNPAVFSKLEQHVALNRAENIVLNPFGLAERQRKETLFFGDSNTGTGNIFEKKEHAVEIELQRLDDYVRSRSFTSLDVVKVDVEGCEQAFWAGAQETMSSFHKLILVMEFNDDATTSARQNIHALFDDIVRQGFRAYLPRAFPFKLTPIDRVPTGFMSNLLFLRGY